jgi:hypothetical protein
VFSEITEAVEVSTENPKKKRKKKKRKTKQHTITRMCIKSNDTNGKTG